MKKVLITIFAILALVWALGAISPQNRECMGTVMGVTGNVVTVLTEDGHVWRFDGQGYHVHDTVELTIFDNDTADVHDDIIMGVKKF